MKRLKKSYFEFGASLVEYGLLISLIAVVCIYSVRTLGRRNLSTICYMHWAVAARCGDPSAGATVLSRCKGGANYNSFWATGFVPGGTYYNACSANGFSAISW